jgi:tetratricopeptide (TPR) repeat protein
VAFFLDWDWTAAEAAFRKALSLDESYTVAGRMLGHVLSQGGRHSEASAVMRRVRELDPLQPMHHAISAQLAYQARDPAAAIEHAGRTVALNPTFWIGYAQQAQALHSIGQSELALEALAKASHFSGNHVPLIGSRGHILATLERLDEARATIDTLHSISATRYVPPTAIAIVYAGLKDPERTFEWLERAYDTRDVNLIFLPVDPRWDPYRADPRFSSLLKRAGFR